MEQEPKKEEANEIENESGRMTTGNEKEKTKYRPTTEYKEKQQEKSNEKKCNLFYNLYHLKNE